MKFEDIGLGPDVLKAIADAGYETPTPIQAQAIPHVLMCRDVLGLAQTGTGKTAGFTLPMIEILSKGRARARMPRSLVLSPTRELAAQISENFETYGKYVNLSMALLTGGVSMGDQKKKLDAGVDVLIATPGRLLDLFQRGNILLADIKILVIDEADRMLDMGFIPDLEKIVSLLPPLRQTLFFSATMPPEIERISKKFLQNPKTVSVAPPASPAKNVTQFLVKANPKHKLHTLVDLVQEIDMDSALVFCNRKRDISGVTRALKKVGKAVGALHGDMVQSARTQTLEEFKAGELKFLVCSDVAARGLDIAALPFVVNFDVPMNADDYVHRIGRTGRAGMKGHAYMLVTGEDEKYLGNIEKLIKSKIPYKTAVKTPESEPKPSKKPEKQPKKTEKNDITGFGEEVPDFFKTSG